MIPLMNLTRQYQSLEQKLDWAALQVLHSGKYILGEEVAQFEREFAAYCGVKYAVGVGNGTDALVIALLAAGVEQGDEVITCAMSFFATAEAIATVGATPVFVDCTRDTYVIDAEKIEQNVTERTKAIIPVHLYGQCAEMEKINEIAKRHHLYVIEDCAQAAGAEYKGKRAGSMGDMGCVSFFPTKNLGCAGDGGMIITYGKKEGIQVDLGHMDFQGNLPKYYNFVIGHNSRLDALQAALLRVKLPYLDGWNKKRCEIAEYYQREITNPAVQKPSRGANSSHIYYVYVLNVEDRDSFRIYMEENGISTGVYFPVPLHLQKAFEQLRYQQGDMPNAEYLAEHGVAIPMFPELEEEEIMEIVNYVNAWEG